jgi:2,3-bisphosphoglycerate-independent phosphoglycerate mutase
VVCLDLDFIRKLVKPAETKIILLVVDGLGGIPGEAGGLTALEAANTPNLDRLAALSICGLQQPVGPGITPGSGPALLALVGYDPIKYQVGQGVLSALGIDFELTPQDVAARGNFCTIDDEGRVVDRRAGCIGTEKSKELCNLLREIELPGVELFVETVGEYRLLFVLRGEKLSGDIADTDPQQVGVKPLPPKPRSPQARNPAGLQREILLVREFLEEAREVLADHRPANMVLLRGFSKRPNWPSMEEVFGLKAAAIAAYPVCRGVARLVGMQVLDSGEKTEEGLGVLEDRWDDFDFFFLHVKRTGGAGEDGDFERKVALIEEVDAQLPRLLNLEPDVVVVSGDHSTPAYLHYHSWHPLPVLLWSRHLRTDGVARFGERACMAGGLGARIPAVDLMPLALANAMRLEKFGA